VNLNIKFSKEEVQVAKKHMKNCLPSQSLKEMKIKNKQNSISLLLELLPTRTPQTTNVCEDAGSNKPSYIAGGDVS
jgi:hypothetical protein